MSSSPRPQEALCPPLPDGKTGLGRAGELPQDTQLVGSGTVVHTPSSLFQGSGSFPPAPQASQRGRRALSTWVGIVYVGEAVC